MKLVGYAFTTYGGAARTAYLPLDDLTVLVGPNDTGKSSVIRALVNGVHLDFVDLEQIAGDEYDDEFPSPGCQWYFMATRAEFAATLLMSDGVSGETDSPYFEDPQPIRKLEHVPGKARPYVLSGEPPAEDSVIGGFLDGLDASVDPALLAALRTSIEFDRVIVAYDLMHPVEYDMSDGVHPVTWRYRSAFSLTTLLRHRLSHCQIMLTTRRFLARQRRWPILATSEIRGCRVR